jgi:hypothetical protein
MKQELGIIGGGKLALAMEMAQLQSSAQSKIVENLEDVIAKRYDFEREPIWIDKIEDPEFTYQDNEPNKRKLNKYRYKSGKTYPSQNNYKTCKKKQ